MQSTPGQHEPSATSLDALAAKAPESRNAVIAQIAEGGPDALKKAQSARDLLDQILEMDRELRGAGHGYGMSKQQAIAARFFAEAGAIRYLTTLLRSDNHPVRFAAAKALRYVPKSVVASRRADLVRAALALIEYKFPRDFVDTGEIGGGQLNVKRDVAALLAVWIGFPIRPAPPDEPNYVDPAIDEVIPTIVARAHQWLEKAGSGDDAKRLDPTTRPR